MYLDSQAENELRMIFSAIVLITLCLKKKKNQDFFFFLNSNIYILCLTIGYFLFSNGILLSSSHKYKNTLNKNFWSIEFLRYTLIENIFLTYN